MNRYGLLAMLAIMAVVPLAQGGEIPSSPGKVEAVTLYRGQALVTCSVPVEAPAGRLEFQVIDLPERVLPDSLFAEGGPGIEVRAVRYQTFAVDKEPRENVRTLDQQIQDAQDGLVKNQKSKELVAMRLKSLEKMEAFTAPTAKVEMTKGVLNVETLKQITLFMFEERKKVMDETLKLDIEQREIKKKLEMLQQQRAKLTSKGTRTMRRALLFLEKRNAAKAEVKLSYLVSGAGWSPSYNFRTLADGKEVEIEYNAVIQQMSGEDWNDIKLTLSTASPALSAQGPDVAPFRVALARSVPKQKGQMDINNALQSLRGQQKSAITRQQNAQFFAENTKFNWDINVAANGFQQLELIAGSDALRVIQDQGPRMSEGPSVSYELPDTVSLSARSDQQMIRISRFKLESTMYQVATPILTSYVYREAMMKNVGKDALLGGPVSVYLDGKFVGRGEIPTVAQGQTFVVGFGADPQLRVRRELVKRDERTQGGNRVVSFKYKLVIENYKDVAVPVRLVDRVPVSERSSDIRVTLLDVAEERLSKDELYVQNEKPKGILRWDIDVPAKASGAKAAVKEYGFTMELDKALSITVPVKAKADELRQEFEEMRYNRRNF